MAIGEARDPRFYGKYRALVTENKDPACRGRIQVNVPAVPSIAKAWAVPCAPYAGKNVGFYTVPPIGALVWVEFEGGNLNDPIWSGCFWDTDEVPGIVKERNSEDPSQVKVLQTRVAKLWIDDTDKKGQVVLEFRDDTVPEPVTVRFTLNSQGLEVICQGSKGTSKITMNPLDIVSDSETLTTNTTKDTTVNAQQNITANATKDITAKAQGKINATATQDVSIQGQNVNGKANLNMSLQATSNFSAKGSVGAKLEGTTVEVSGSAATTIKGAIVKIN